MLFNICSLYYNLLWNGSFILDAKENDSEKSVTKPASKNLRKRKAASENIPGMILYSFFQNL